VDLTPLSNVGGNPPQLEEGGVVTTSEIIRQISSAFAAPVD
jgi:hypothetical protein